MNRPALQIKQVGVSRMVFRDWKVFGTFEKRAHDPNHWPDYRDQRANFKADLLYWAESSNLFKNVDYFITVAFRIRAFLLIPLCMIIRMCSRAVGQVSWRTKPLANVHASIVTRPKCCPWTPTTAGTWNESKNVLIRGNHTIWRSDKSTDFLTLPAQSYKALSWAISVWLKSSRWPSGLLGSPRARMVGFPFFEKDVFP